jgi:peroxiredoxin
MGGEVGQSGEHVRPPEIGQSAPDFALYSIEGQFMALSDFRGRRVLLWISRGVFCALCRVAMSQLQRSYPEFQRRSTEFLEIGPSLPANAVRGFRQYFGGRLPEFPYLCDPNFTVHRQYGLRPVGGRETLNTNALTMGAQVTDRPLLTPTTDDVSKLNAHPMEQGLFIIDELGLIQYVFVTSPSGKVPSAGILLAELDRQTGSS